MKPVAFNVTLPNLSEPATLIFLTCICTFFSYLFSFVYVHTYYIHSTLETMPFFHLPNQPNQPQPPPGENATTCVHCQRPNFWGQGVSAFQVDDGRSFVGDLYWAKLPSHPVTLGSRWVGRLEGPVGFYCLMASFTHPQVWRTKIPWFFNEWFTFFFL